jgi:CDP-diacylglycerol---serine O-phosphatidyltransferase
VKRHIPNFITCCNLICGCIGIVQAFRGNLEVAAYLTGLAAVFDFLDGMLARLLKAYSPIGKELDSLADMVTFGVLPAVVMYQLITLSLSQKEGLCLDTLCVVLPYVAFLLTVFSALRLAIFNVDTRQAESFIGVPTPANAIFMVSLPLIGAYNPFGLEEFILNPWLLIGLTLLFSYLMVAPLPLFSLKMKSLSLEQNKTRYLFFLLSLVLVVALNYIAIPLIILLYILLSVINNFSTK